ncbi:MAG: FAD-dependent oxidoreductase [Betaproteobacteria bacterium]|nr:FAD-dependent oxidoreductase [Betaproteobacteria bacterium]
MSSTILISGAGIAGLSAALALSRAGVWVKVVERENALVSEGAGVQLGPNVTRILRAWGLGSGLRDKGFFPKFLCAHDARDGRVLGQSDLAQALQHYGAPHVCIHRADLQALLWQGLQGQGQWHWGHTLQTVHPADTHVMVRSASGQAWQGDGLVVADGIGSKLRQAVSGDGPATPTGHVALRALLPMTEVPRQWRTTNVHVWMGERFHLVHYPVRDGQWLNLVLVIHRRDSRETDHWSWLGEGLWAQQAVSDSCAAVCDLIGAVAQWRYWVLADRAPMRSATDMAVGRIAMIGDAAHPMRPYFAQGAGMAIEDAAALQWAWQHRGDQGVDLAWRAMADSRWRRVAQVQAQSRRNGLVFHSTGWLRWGRDAALQTLGSRLMNPAWLYGGGPRPVDGGGGVHDGPVTGR